MSFTITTENWTTTSVINELVTALNERLAAVGLEQLAAIPDYTDLQSYTLWLTLQQKLEEAAVQYVYANSDHTAVSSTVEAWREAAGINVNGYRRMTSDGVQTYGPHEAYDVIGPWLWEDMIAGIRALKWMALSVDNVARVRGIYPSLNTVITAPTYLHLDGHANSTMYFNFDKVTSKDVMEIAAAIQNPIYPAGYQYTSDADDYTSFGLWMFGFPTPPGFPTYIWLSDTRAKTGTHSASLTCVDLAFVSLQKVTDVDVADIVSSRSDKELSVSFSSSTGGYVYFYTLIVLVPPFVHT